MRVLHLLDLRDPHDLSDESLTACATAVGVAGCEHRVLAVGSRRSLERARRTRVLVDAVVPSVGPWPELSSRRLRRVLTDRNGRDATRPWADVVQCWSPSVLGLARLASGERTPPRVGALLRPPTAEPSPLEWGRLAFGLHYAHLFTLDRATRAAWAQAASWRRGGRLLEQNIRLFDPPIDHRPIAPNERAAAREQLGIEPDQFAVMLLADPPSAGDVSRLMFLIGLVYTSGTEAVGIVRRGGRNQARAARFLRMHGRRWGLFDSDLPTRTLLAASDLAVWDCGDADSGGCVSTGPVSIALALGAGVPVVASRHPISLAALGELGAALIARDQSPSAMAERVLCMIGDNSLRTRMADRGRAVAARPGASDAFANDLIALWREATNAPVAREGLPLPPSLDRPESLSRLGGIA